MLNFLWLIKCNSPCKWVLSYAIIILPLYLWQRSRSCRLFLTMFPYTWSASAFCYLWPQPSYMFVTVCHHRWARYPAACHRSVEENTFKGAAGPTGKTALEKLDLQSSDRKGISGVDFLAVIPITYSKMGWYTAGWLPSSFSWGLCHPLSWLISTWINLVFTLFRHIWLLPSISKAL